VTDWSWAVVETASGSVVESEAVGHCFNPDVDGPTRTITTAFGFCYPRLLKGKEKYLIWSSVYISPMIL